MLIHPPLRLSDNYGENEVKWNISFNKFNLSILHFDELNKNSIAQYDKNKTPKCQTCRILRQF